MKLLFPHQKQPSKRKIGVTLNQNALTNHITQKFLRKKIPKIHNKKTKTKSMNVR